MGSFLCLRTVFAQFIRSFVGFRYAIFKAKEVIKMFNPYFNNAIPNYNSQYNPVASGYSYGNQMPKQEITEVYGLQGAQAFQMGANSSTILLDASNPVVYIKKTDGGGSASISVFKLVPCENDNTSDLEKRVKKLEEIINESYSVNASEFRQRKSAESDSSN